MSAPPHRSDFRKVFVLLGVGVTGLFALLVILGLLYFRAEIRHQILRRDGIHLTSVANFLSADAPDDDLPEWTLLSLALETSEIEGIIAVRVFDARGNYLQGVPGNLHPDELKPADRELLDSGHPVVQSYSKYPQYALFNDFDSEVSQSVPLVEVISPILTREDTALGFIQFWLDGSAVTGEFQRLDQKLVLSGILLISGSGLIVLILFTFARRRLQNMASLLASRNRSLEKANAELAMAAKTSAIGSVASHLFHGLKNPLAGLKTYLKVTGRDEEAVAIADRMQSLIDESLSVIRDQDLSGNGQVSIEELKESILSRLEDLASGGHHQLSVEHSGQGDLHPRQVQLLLLVIRNLVENAMEASPDGSTVHVRLIQDKESFMVEVEDTGPGLPEAIRSRLFEPVQSTKSGGTGIGLAISSVIARHIPADLQLKASSPAGTVFSITFTN